MEHIAALHAGDHVRCKSRRDTPLVFEYRPELATCELIAELLRLLDIERGAERLVCRYLADLADRVQRRQELMLDAYADELHAARCCFGLGPREARERVRIGRALRQLPEVERALVGGELSYSRVREITRVATPATEAEWLELARQLDMRTLERRVARTQTGTEGAPEAEVVSPKTRRVTFELSEEAWALLESALESARRASGEDCSDSQALEVVARVALSAQGTEVVPHELAHASSVPASNTAAGTTASTSTAGGAARSVRPWSWDDLGWGATQSGSSTPRNKPSNDAPAGSSDDCGAHRSSHGTANGVERGEWGEINSRLLQAMGGRGRWSADSLIEASGLSAREVNVALTYLQLGGRILRRNDVFEPI